MKEPVAYDDAVDLLDADHKAVKKMFIDHAALCEDGAPAPARRLLALRICESLTVHAQIEEEIFYPQVSQAIGDDALMEAAQQEHAQAKELIAQIQAMKATDAAHDAAVARLGALIDQHVLAEREQIFLKARQAAMDLRDMVLPLMQRQRALKKIAATPAKETA
jgi:hemerythrin superfamily protein